MSKNEKFIVLSTRNVARVENVTFTTDVGQKPPDNSTVVVRRVSLEDAQRYITSSLNTSVISSVAQMHPDCSGRKDTSSARVSLNVHPMDILDNLKRSSS